MKASESLIEMLIDKQVLKFGSFKLNSGRISPYFFNLGAIDDGMSFYDLGLAYARKIHDKEFVCAIYISLRKPVLRRVEDKKGPKKAATHSHNPRH